MYAFIFIMDSVHKEFQIVPHMGQFGTVDVAVFDAYIFLL